MSIKNNNIRIHKEMIAWFYYRIRPILPRFAQIHLRRFIAYIKRKQSARYWPINYDAGQTPKDWQGWPDGKSFAFVLTHDVETAKGLARCQKVAELEMSMGFRSSFNFLTEKYEVPATLLSFLRTNGFEIGVHGVHHDGKLFDSYVIFKERARQINYYLKKWGAVGFRAPSMHCNLEWIMELNVEYDMSTFDTDPFEPRAHGVGTIFPFLVNRSGYNKSFVELPYTLPQDSTLFNILRERNSDIWKRKLDWIVEKDGMALMLVHPDYMCFDPGGKRNFEEYDARLYGDFLAHFREKYKDQYYHVLPRDLAKFMLKNRARQQESATPSTQIP